MLSREHPSIAIRHDTRGVAMLEFVLMLPFIWIVLALILNFGLAYSERQRAMVAVRETAMRHGAASGARAAPSIDAIGDEVAAEMLAPRKMAVAFVYSSEDGTCPSDGDAADDTPRQNAFRSFQGYIGDISSSQSYHLAAEGQPLVGTALPQPVHRVCFAIDSGSWTYDETGDPIDWLGDRLAGLGREIVGAIF